jgi:hypothetical protein
MANKIEFIVLQDENKIPVEFDLETDEPGIIIGTSLNELFKLEKLYRNIGVKETIKYNRPFNIRLLVNSKLIFDTTNYRYDDVRPNLKLNRSAESRKLFTQFVNQISKEYMEKQ